MAVSCLLLAGAARADHTLRASDHKVAPPGPLVLPDVQLEPLTWSKLDGWANDDHAAAYATFLASCRALIGGAKKSEKTKPENKTKLEKTPRDARPLYVPLVEVCRRARAALPLDEARARHFFEENFRPVRISKLDDTNGFLTGYYEPIVDGSRVPTDDFKAPLYRRPHDLVHLGRKRKAEGFPNTGRVVRRLARGKYQPYFDRAQIEDGALAVRNLEICYVKDWVEALFIQIQGSARIRLEDGTILRVNYDSHNGYRYLPVGRVLIEQNIIPREEMSMERIRKWMAENPEGAKDVRRQNKSFVFFRLTGLSEFDEAVGAQGVPLTAARSIAVDKGLHVYGTPFFIEADLPIATETSSTKFRRLMIAQDTGSAIVGPARADIYFGAGEQAGRVSGRIKNPGRFVMLIPRELDMIAAGHKMPLPHRRPASAPKPVPPDDAKAQAEAAPNAEPVPLPRPRPKS